MDFTVYGIRIPLAFTIWAKREISKAFQNDPNGIQKAFLVETDIELAENMAKIGSIMSKAYAMRARSLEKLTGETDDSHAIDEDELFELLDRDLTVELVKAITDTVQNANKTSVEVKGEKKDEATE